jgi:hypothetical protein
MSRTIEIIQAKLSKKYFMTIPTGKYLVSGVGYSPTRRCFMEYVAPLPKRHEQWKRIVEASVDQRSCFSYENAEKYNLDMEQYFSVERR